MERFIEDLEKNHCKVLSLEFVDENTALLQVKPPVSSTNVASREMQTLPNHPLFMLQLRLNTTIEYEETAPGIYEVRIENPRKPFSEEALRKAAEKQQVPFLLQANERVKKSEEEKKTGEKRLRGGEA